MKKTAGEQAHKGHRGMEEACFPHLYEPINHTKPSSKTERHRHLAHAYDFQHVQTNAIPDATGDFFFGTSLPKKGWGGVGARSSSSKYPQPPQQQQRAPGETR